MLRLLGVAVAEAHVGHEGEPAVLGQHRVGDLERLERRDVERAVVRPQLGHLVRRDLPACQRVPEVVGLDRAAGGEGARRPHHRAEALRRLERRAFVVAVGEDDLLDLLDFVGHLEGIQQHLQAGQPVGADPPAVGVNSRPVPDSGGDLVHGRRPYCKKSCNVQDFLLIERRPSERRVAATQGPASGGTNCGRRAAGANRPGRRARGSAQREPVSSPRRRQRNAASPKDNIARARR